jgi:hypothetical protein
MGHDYVAREKFTGNGGTCFEWKTSDGSLGGDYEGTTPCIPIKVNP